MRSQLREHASVGKRLVDNIDFQPSLDCPKDRSKNIRFNTPRYRLHHSGGRRTSKPCISRLHSSVQDSFEVVLGSDQQESLKNLGNERTGRDVAFFTHQFVLNIVWRDLLVGTQSTEACGVDTPTDLRGRCGFTYYRANTHAIRSDKSAAPSPQRTSSRSATSQSPILFSLPVVFLC